MKIICINGFPRSGKSSFCDFCIEEAFGTGYEVYSYSTVDLVKQIAKELGWDGTKTLKDRKFLSNLKNILTEWNDIPIKYIKETILYHLNNKEHPWDDFIFFIHTRESEELERLKKEWNAKTLLIRRAAVEDKEQSNHADANVLNFNYDFVVENDGSLDDLRGQAINFIDFVMTQEEWESEVEECKTLEQKEC